MTTQAVVVELLRLEPAGKIVKSESRENRRGEWAGPVLSRANVWRCWRTEGSAGRAAGCEWAKEGGGAHCCVKVSRTSMESLSKGCGEAGPNVDTYSEWLPVLDTLLSGIE